MKLVEQRVGYSDLLHLPEDGPQYELYDGEVWRVPSRLPIYHFVRQYLYSLLWEACASHGGL